MITQLKSGELKLPTLSGLLLEGLPDGVMAISFDGKIVLTGHSDGRIRVWELSAGKLINEFKAHNGQITSISFSPNGSLIATSSTDGTACVWNSKSYRQLFVFSDDKGPVTGVAFTPDGKYTITRSANGLLMYWDNKTGLLFKARSTYITTGTEG
jgi:WD40 repeat protein